MENFDEKNFNSDLFSDPVRDRQSGNGRGDKLRLLRNAIRNNWQIFVLAFGILGLGLLPSQSALAYSSITSQFASSTYIQGSGTAPDYHGQIFTPNVFGWVYQVQYEAEEATSSVNQFIFSRSNGSVLATSTHTTANGEGGGVRWHTIDLTNPVFVSPFNSYFYGLQLTSGSGVSQYGSNANPYATGCVLQNYTSGDLFNSTSTCTGDVYDTAFNILGTIGYSSSTNYFYNLQVQVNTTSSTQDCSAYFNDNFFSSSTLGGMGCIGKQIMRDAISVFLVPTTGLTFLNQQFTNFQNLFPFSLFFNINSLIETQLQHYASSTNQGLDFPIKFPNTSTTNIYITSSTFTGVFGSPAMQLVFDLQQAIAWLIVGWLMVKMILKKNK